MPIEKTFSQSQPQPQLQFQHRIAGGPAVGTGSISAANKFIREQKSRDHEKEKYELKFKEQINSFVDKQNLKMTTTSSHLAGAPILTPVLLPAPIITPTPAVPIARTKTITFSIPREMKTITLDLK